MYNIYILLLSTFFKSEVEIIRNPCQAGIVTLQAWHGLVFRKQETNFLEEIHCEEKYLISCQQFPHTDPLPNTKRNHFF